jgi:hypothetical protein
VAALANDMRLLADRAEEIFNPAFVFRIVEH